MFYLSTSNYWLNINKPYGISSSKVVSIVKKIVGAKKVGHAGTLDPLATGVLPIAVNKATKTCDYIMQNDKEYYFEATWGEFRDTDDFEGKVIKTSNKIPEISEIISILPNFIGKIDQIPSKFSAIKINGNKAYELARKGLEFEIKSREVRITKINLIFHKNNKTGFKVSCSKGTYVRSLNRDIALKLDSCAYVSSLKRLKTGCFDIKNTISLDKLKNLSKVGGIDDSVFKLRDVLSFMAEIVINNDLAFKLKNGQIVQLETSLTNFSGDAVKIINNDEVIGLGKIYENKLKPINIFNNL